VLSQGESILVALLRTYYLQDSFNGTLQRKESTYPEKPKLFEFYDSCFFAEAYRAAAAVDSLLSNTARNWLDRVTEDGLLVAIEQSCDDGLLVAVDQHLRSLRWFEVETARRCELSLATLPLNGGSALERAYWWVRIERAMRTGSPQFNPGSTNS